MRARRSLHARLTLALAGGFLPYLLPEGAGRGPRRLVLTGTKAPPTCLRDTGLGRQALLCHCTGSGETLPAPESSSASLELRDHP